MTKENLIDLLTTQLAASDITGPMMRKLHQRDIEQLVSMAYNNILFEAYNAFKKTKDTSNFDQYIKTYKDVDVTFDASRDEYYSIIPVTLAQLPNNNAIRVISPKRGQRQAFVYQDNTAVAIFGNLEVDSIMTQTTFYVEGQNVYYEDLGVGQTQVMMKLIPVFTELSDEDEVYIPAGKDQVVFEFVVKALMGRGNEQMANNNTSKPV
jgi:hypothetical protein